METALHSSNFNFTENSDVKSLAFSRRFKKICLTLEYDINSKLRIWVIWSDSQQVHQTCVSMKTKTPRADHADSLSGIHFHINKSKFVYDTAGLTW